MDTKTKMASKMSTSVTCMMTRPTMTTTEARGSQGQGSVFDCEKKKSRGKRWADWETIALAQFVRDNSRELFGSGGGPGVEQIKRKAWQRAEQTLRAAGGIDRGGWEAIRKKWSDVSFRAKEYHRKRIGRNVTGGGNQPEANIAMEAVLDALPQEVTGGIVPAGVCETAPKPVTKEVSPPPDGTSGHVLQEGSREFSPPPSTQLPGASLPNLTDTESESQESLPSQNGKRRKPQQVAKKNQKKQKSSKEVELLQLNREILEFEKKKMKYREDKLAMQQQIIDVLQRISANIEKLVPTPIQFIVDSEE